MAMEWSMVLERHPFDMMGWRWFSMEANHRLEKMYVKNKQRLFVCSYHSLLILPLQWGKVLLKFEFDQIQPSQNDMHKISFGSSVCLEKNRMFLRY